MGAVDENSVDASPPTAASRATDLRCQFARVHALSFALVAGLSDADTSGQSMADASPAKWHLAHTTWFFETFVLRDFIRGYRPFDPTFAFLYNSYYEAEGNRLGRAARGMLTRPSLDEVLAYRRHVDWATLSALDDLPTAVRQLILLGCNREQQHEELLLTDLLHLFAQNPLLPKVYPSGDCYVSVAPGPLRWIEGRYGPADIRHDAGTSPSTVKDRVIPCGCHRMRWRIAWLPMASGTPSLMMEAIPARISGYRTVGHGCGGTESKRPCIGGATQMLRGRGNSDSTVSVVRRHPKLVQGRHPNLVHPGCNDRRGPRPCGLVRVVHRQTGSARRGAPPKCSQSGAPSQSACGPTWASVAPTALEHLRR